VLPPLLIVATPVVSELHCTVPVMFCVLPSVYVPVAVNCCVVPSGIDGIAGVTAIVTSTAGVTVKVVEPEIAPNVAVTLLLPKATLLTSPCPFTVAMLLSAVLQVTELVTSMVLPSLYVPVAANCCVVPSANDGFTGLTANDTSIGCPTLRLAVAVMDPDVAVMVAPPMPAPAANPLAPIVATVVADELQLTALVTSCVLPSVYVPVAANCWLVPFAIVALVGLIESDVKTGGVTARAAEPLIVPEVAVIAVVPWATLLASPPLPMVATEVRDEVH